MDSLSHFAGHGLLVSMALVVAALAATAAQVAWAAEPWRTGRINDEALAQRSRPRLAATAAELARLRAAWDSEGPAHDALARVFTRADHVIAGGLEIPPEGGQHNQWYQCEACQMALKTISPTKHKCPRCGKLYSGYPYDNVLYNRRHLTASWRMNDAGWAYAVTGGTRYARFVAETLLHYADMYPRLPVQSPSVGTRDGKLSEAARRSGGKINPQTLTESMWLTTAAPAYDLIYNAGVLTDEQKRTIETDLFAAMAKRIGGHRAGKSNWQTWHNAALLYAGAVIGDAELVNRAIHDPDNGFACQMRISVLPEGMWYENSWGYHYYTLAGMTRLAEGARRLGVDLYGHPMLRKMYLIGFDYRLSDGSLPRFGDSTGGSVRHDAANEPAYRAYGDPRILSVLPKTPTFDTVRYGRDTSKRAQLPPPTSKLFAGAGHAILHAQGPGKLSAAIAFGGRELGVDPGRAKSQAYRLPIHSEWYKATIGHNCVLIDGADQQPATGELFAYAAGGGYTGVVAGAGEICAGVTHSRFLLLTQRYLLIVDELTRTDDRDHVFGWVYHNRSENVRLDLKAGSIDPQKLPPSAGMAYLEDKTTYLAEPGDPIRGVFGGESVDVHLTSAVISDDREPPPVLAATGPLGSVADRVPMVIIASTTRGKPVHYATVLEPLAKGDPPTVKTVRILRNTGQLAVLVQGAAGDQRVRFGSGDLTGGFVVEHAEKRGTPRVVLSATPAADG